jgi:hypothetical protein
VLLIVVLALTGGNDAASASAATLPSVRSFNPVP